MATAVAIVRSDVNLSLCSGKARRDWSRRKRRKIAFNAEGTSAGEYTKYPDRLSDEGTQYLGNTVEELAQAAAVDGSHIVINKSLRMIAKDGMWWQVERGSTLENPRLKAPVAQIGPKDENKV